VRSQATAESVRTFARALGRAATSPACVYLVGGATAVLEGWRASTIDLDIRIEPDDDLLRAISELKERLNINVELASPADFLPQLPEWRSRSPFLFREGLVEFFHYDLYSQALAKLERGLAQDLADVRSMIATNGVKPVVLARLFEAIEPDLYRFPAVDPEALRAAVAQMTPG
jgi:hypothetical protein